MKRRGAKRWIAFGLVAMSAGDARLLAAEPTVAPGPPTQPIPSIEVGMHTAMINRIAADRAGTKLLTASDDKTARVWDVATGRLLRVLRPPISPANDGKLYAGVLSPDGSTAAVGGWTGFDWERSNGIYLFSVASGELTGRLSGLPREVLDLAYSPDGTLLAAAMGQGKGVRVFRVPSLQQVFSDEDYHDGSYSVDFDASGRLLAASDDGELRLYDRDMHLVARKSVPGGKDPQCAKFSPDGNLVAVGFYDSPVVSVADGHDLSFRYAPDVSGIVGGNLAIIGWSAGGERLYAGGRHGEGGLFPLFAWSEAGKGPRSVVTGALNTFMSITPLPGGEMAFASTAPQWAVIDRSGNRRVEHYPPGADFRHKSARLSISGTGSLVQFVYDVWQQARWNESSMTFDARDLSLGRDVRSDAPTLDPPRTSGLPVTDWRNLTSPKLGGKPLPLDPYETSRSLAVSIDGGSFILGADWNLRLFDRNGQRRWEVPVPSPAWAVSLTADGHLALAAFGDGTIRWYSVADGRERLALLALPDGKRWVAWTPEGFFAAAPGAETMAGYTLNQGADHAATFVALDQLASLFHRPDLVSQALSPDGPQKIQEALARIGDVRAVLAAGLPPSLEILEQRREGNEIVLRVKATDRGGGVGKLVFRVNGVALEPRSTVPSVPGEEAVTVRLPLPEGTSKVSAAAFNRGGAIESPPVAITVDVPAPQRGGRPTLHVLAVGVTDYRDHSLALKHASADARAVASALGAHARGLFGRVNVPTPLIDREVTLANLTRRFEALAPDVKPDDVFVFYAAGHGTVVDGRYMLVPADLVYSNGDSLSRDAIDEQKLNTLLAKIPAQKSLILLDTCSAGAFGEAKPEGTRSLDEKGAIDRMMKATGRAVLAAAASKKMALEGYKGHGVFTAALLEGLGPSADRNHDGLVDIFELAAFIGGEVPRITKKVFHYEQFPMSRLDVIGEAFPIAAVPK
jgi:hypothetical protein